MNTTTPHVRVAWTAGPDAGGHALLIPGRHVLGRAADCALSSQDPSLDAHHALVEVAVDQSTGGATLGLIPLSRRLTPALGASLEVGDGLLQITELQTTGQAAARPLGRGAGPVLRRPRSLPAPPLAPEPEPETPTFEPVPTLSGSWLTTLLPSVLGLLGSMAIAAVTGQVMFAVFGALGSLIGLAGWVATTIADRRQRHRDERGRQRRVAELAAERDGYREAVSAHHRRTTTDLAAALAALHDADGALWERRPTHPDAWTIGLGPGEIAWPDCDPSLGGFPGTITTDIAPGTRLAIVGEPAVTTPVARALLVQLMVQLGPSDLHVVIVTRTPLAWQWLAPAPHLAAGDGRVTIVDEHELGNVIGAIGSPAGRSHIVIATDCAEALVERGSPLRRILADGEHALMVTVASETTVPHVCTSALHVGRTMRGRWSADLTRAGLPVSVHVAGLSQNRAESAVAVLAACVDPDHLATDARRLPDRVDLSTLLGRPSADQVLARWAMGGPDPAPRASIGMTAHHTSIADCTIDLAADGPHMLVAGTTGAGKSELLRSLVVGLAASTSPDLLQFVLVDFKGGATFDALVDLPHVVGVVTDLDDALVDRCLRSLGAELRRREVALRSSGSRDLGEHRAGGHADLARLVVVIDEFAGLATEHTDRMATLLSIAQRGRSLGLHLVLATQRPAGVVNDQVRANTALRLALRVHDTADALDVVGDTAPAHFARRLPGRAMIRFDGDERLVAQTAYTADDRSWVSAITAATVQRGISPATCLWSEPLPQRCPWSADDADRIGWLDGLDGGAHEPLRAPDHHLAIVGGSATDRRASLDTLARSARVAGTDVYVLGTPLGIGGVETVAVDDTERRLRLAGRARSGDRGALVLIDDVRLLRHVLDHDPFDELDRWTDILRHRDVRLVVAAAHPSDLPTAWCAAIAHRWVLPLADPHDAVGLGVPVGQLATTAGGRCTVVAPGADARPAVIGVWDGSLTVTGHPPTTAIHRLPAQLDGDEPEVADAVSSRTSDEQVVLTVGLTTDLGAAALVLGDGEHALVLGPPRSGRSTALARLLEQWSQVHASEPTRTVVLAPRRTTLRHDHLVRSVDDLCAAADVDEHTRLLIVVDDAEMVDDPRLAVMMSRPGCTIFAAANPTALRQQYGHWTTALRRSHTGLVLARSDRMDGELLGAMLPRDLPVAPRPGLAWLVQQATPTLVQIAMPTSSGLQRPRLALA